MTGTVSSTILVGEFVWFSMCQVKIFCLVKKSMEEIHLLLHITTVAFILTHNEELLSYSV